MRGRGREVVTLAAVAVFAAAVILLGMPIVLALPPGAGRVAANVGVYLLLAAGVLVVNFPLEHRSWADLGVVRRRPGRQVVWALGVWGVLLAVFVGLPLALGMAPGDLLPSAPRSAGVLAVQAAFFLLVVGPVEELVFRGYFFERLRHLTGSGVWAVAISSVLFGAWHYVGSGNLAQVAVTTLVGIVLGCARWRGRACTTASVALAHGLYDTSLRVLATVLG